MSPPPVRIFYLVPDVDRPSWGIGLLYAHVRLLRTLGWRAFALHRRRPFRLGWCDDVPPIRYRDDPDLDLRADDALVVPEALAGEVDGLAFSGRKALFAQGIAPLFAAIPGRRTFDRLGFDRTLTILPHAARVLERFFGTEPSIVPPFVAPFFFVDPRRLDTGRAHRVLLHVKDEVEQAGYADRRIFETLWRENTPEGWRLDRFAGLDHRQVAERMTDSAFLVNLNPIEAFNTTVPEAMATGCLVLCYRAVGGRDFLDDGVNALVFEGHDVATLAERLLGEIAAFERGDPALAERRRRARATAERYTEVRTREALDGFFRDWLA